MATEIIDCEEFGEIRVGIGALIENGELKVDDRISGRGYLNVSFVRGQVIFRADRHVGLIPINEKYAVRVKPRSNIANLSYMLAKSGVVPVAVSEFSRGYLPRFETSNKLEDVYAKSMIAAAERVLSRGLMRSYIRDPDPPAWRGRFLVTQTIKEHRSRGIRHRHVFDFSTLSHDTIENVSLKEALTFLERWLVAKDTKNVDIPRIRQMLNRLNDVTPWRGKTSALVAELGRRINLLPEQLSYYRDPLWTAYLLLQHNLPDVSGDGLVTLDSLIIDVSKVFEGYIRWVLSERVAKRGWSIRDGNIWPGKFFIDSDDYRIKPDIVIMSGPKPIAILDAKYKLDPKEGDRYEVLSFMDATDVKLGGFILPFKAGDRSRYMGVTAGGKSISDLRFDLAAADLDVEADRLFKNICGLVDGTHHYV